MIAKIVCRLLDAKGVMLGWCEHYAIARGDGCLRSDGRVVIPIERDGSPVVISLSWCEINTETRVPFPPLKKPLSIGDSVSIYEDGNPMITVGKPPIGLPAVTVGRPIAVTIPTGALGAGTGLLELR